MPARNTHRHPDRGHVSYRHRLFTVIWVSLLSLTLLSAATPLTASFESPHNPPTPEGLPPTKNDAKNYAANTVATMSLQHKIGQLFVADVWGKSAFDKNTQNQQKYGVATPAQVVQQYHVGGVIYFNNSDKDNVDSPQQVGEFSRGLQTTAGNSEPKIPLLISTDQEGGRVTRIGSPATEFPSNMAIGATRNTDIAQEVASISAQELHSMGINQNFAPDADVNSNPLNPVIGSRSFSSDPALVGKLTAAAVKGFQENQDSPISAVAKHFPGHGDAATDSHYGLPIINRSEKSWRDTDLPPFKAAVDTGVDAIMTAHISIPSIDSSGQPATLSKPIITGILRDELQYSGVVVTDSLQMQGVRQMYSDAEIAIRALEAGADQLLMPGDLKKAITGVEEAVHSGRISQQRVDESVTRILELKVKRGIIQQSPSHITGINPHQQQNQQKVQNIAAMGTTLVRNENNLLPLKNNEKILVTGWERQDYPGYPATPVTSLARGLGKSAIARPTGANPSDVEINHVAADAKTVDVVVVLINGLRAGSAQKKLLDVLSHSGAKVVTVSVQEPYDVALVKNSAIVATYDWRDVSMVALAQVLSGKINPQGKLPVDVHAQNSQEILYRAGHGLRY